MLNLKVNLSKITQKGKVMASKSNIKPDLQMSMQDKIYLAVVQNYADKLAFVQMLVCLQDCGGMYKAHPVEEIMTFANRAKANIYYKTLLQSQKAQQQTKGFGRFFEYNKDIIDEFNSRER